MWSKIFYWKLTKSDGWWHTLHPITSISQMMLVAPSPICATVLHHLISIIWIHEFIYHMEWINGGLIKLGKDQNFDQNQTHQNQHISQMDNFVEGIFNWIWLLPSTGIILYIQKWTYWNGEFTYCGRKQEFKWHCALYNVNIIIKKGQETYKKDC